LAESISKDDEVIEYVLEKLSQIIKPGSPPDTRRVALVVVRTFARLHYDKIESHIALLAPPIFASVRDIIIPVKLAAESAFVTIFSVVAAESTIFDEYMASQAASDLPANTKRSMSDYFKRVALKLADQERERKLAEGGSGGLGLGDEEEDEEEVGKVGGGVW
jgi:hypothetical protein